VEILAVCLFTKFSLILYMALINASKTTEFEGSLIITGNIVIVIVRLSLLSSTSS